MAMGFGADGLEQIVAGAAIHAAEFLGAGNAEHRCEAFIERTECEGTFVSEGAAVEQRSADAQRAAGTASFGERDNQSDETEQHSGDDDAFEISDVGGFVIEEKHHNRGKGAKHAEQVQNRP
jgi:hypothetical protein